MFRENFVRYLSFDHAPYELDMLLFVPMHSSVTDVRRV